MRYSHSDLSPLLACAQRSTTQHVISFRASNLKLQLTVLECRDSTSVATLHLNSGLTMGAKSLFSTTKGTDKNKFVDHRFKQQRMKCV
jgi:hypothetical protein